MAKPFHFPLQKVLDYREQLEDRARLALAKAHKAHEQQRGVVEDLKERLTRHQRRGAGQDADANDIWLWQQYKQALEQDLSSAQGRLSKLALNLQKCRREAVQASKDRKLLDKLKQQQAARHRDEEQRREEKENDEMAALRFRHKDF